MTPAASTVSLKSTNVIQQDANGNKLLITNTTSTSRKVIITRKPSLSSPDGGGNNNHQNGNQQPMEFKTENCVKEENNNKITKKIKNGGTDMNDALAHNGNNNNSLSSVTMKLCPNGDGSVLMSGNHQTHHGLNGFQESNGDTNNNNNNGENPHGNGVSTSTSILNITPLNQKGIFLQQMPQHQQQGVHSSENGNIILQGRFSNFNSTYTLHIEISRNQNLLCE